MSFIIKSWNALLSNEHDRGGQIVIRVWADVYVFLIRDNEITGRVRAGMTSVSRDWVWLWGTRSFATPRASGN